MSEEITLTEVLEALAEAETHDKGWTYKDLEGRLKMNHRAVKKLMEKAIAKGLILVSRRLEAPVTAPWQKRHVTVFRPAPHG